MSEHSEEKHTYIVQKSGNKLKKWMVRRLLIKDTVPEIESDEDNKIADTDQIADNKPNTGNKPKRGRKPGPNSKPKKISDRLKYGKPVYFGQSGYRDYTVMNQPGYELKNAEEPDYIKSIYLKRHKNEDWTDLKKAGTWASGLLWNKPTMEESAKDMEKKFNIEIILDLETEPVKRVLKKKESNEAKIKEE